MSTAVGGTATWEICVGAKLSRVLRPKPKDRQFRGVTLPSAFTAEQSARCAAPGMVGNAWPVDMRHGMGRKITWVEEVDLLTKRRNSGMHRSIRFGQFCRPQPRVPGFIHSYEYREYLYSQARRVTVTVMFWPDINTLEHQKALKFLYFLQQKIKGSKDEAQPAAALVNQPTKDFEQYLSLSHGYNLTSAGKSESSTSYWKTLLQPEIKSEVERFMAEKFGP
ncbi:hypothetical protein ARMGADRAFT_1026316 [Armillaria gallica]|uniref:Uncharacterized protein n=1 Tax=Armillaria gallica TaxID=47427 RepID=A0A2H3EA54_ARMGA|nr:hypothetical protein ARMGADRAFT_1026316 [Armillaria gallica]